MRVLSHGVELHNAFKVQKSAPQVTSDISCLSHIHLVLSTFQTRCVTRTRNYEYAQLGRIALPNTRVIINKRDVAQLSVVLCVKNFPTQVHYPFEWSNRIRSISTRFKLIKCFTNPSDHEEGGKKSEQLFAMFFPSSNRSQMSRRK